MKKSGKWLGGALTLAVLPFAVSMAYAETAIKDKHMSAPEAA